MIEQLFDGLMLALDWQVLLAILLGSIGGIIVGALPGLSSTLGVALLIPFTFGLSAPVAFGLLGGMYCSSIYGGSITAILINTPGTGAAAATVLDGYPMTQKGQAGKALATAIWSFWRCVFHRGTSGHGASAVADCFTLWPSGNIYGMSVWFDHYRFGIHRFHVERHFVRPYWPVDRHGGAGSSNRLWTLHLCPVCTV